MATLRCRVMRRVACFALFFALSTNGCAQEHNCHVVGASAGVRITGAAGQVPVRICLDRECHVATLRGGVGFVPLSALTPGSSARLGVTVTTATGSMTSVVTVVPQRFQPNGAGCEPSVGAADLKIDSSGRATG